VQFERRTEASVQTRLLRPDYGPTTTKLARTLSPKLSNLAWNDGPAPMKDYYSTDAPVTMIDQLEGTLWQGSPVLVQVPHRSGLCQPPTDPTLGHFVVVTNAQLDPSSPDVDSQGNHVRFYIEDPGCNPSTAVPVTTPPNTGPNTGIYLDDYAIGSKLNFQIRGFLTDPTDFSYLNVGSSDNVNITLTNSSGQRVGYDPTSGQNVQEIPNSFYFHDVDDDPTGEIMNSANTLSVKAPTSGSYLLSVTGGEGGVFTITVNGIASDGSAPTRQVIVGTSVPGTTMSYSISYSSTPGEQLVVQPPQIAGDLNGDGKVDCSDVAIVKAAFATILGGPGFNPLADVNGDGVVNVLDLAMVARHLPVGTTCP